MATSTITVTLTLDARESALLRRLLGSMETHEFADQGIHGIDREVMNEIWDALPTAEDH